MASLYTEETVDGSNWTGRGQQACKKASETRETHTGRDDRATVEQVMDPRTRMILFKLLSTGFLEEIHGCISTGKEANVYYAKAGEAGMIALSKANKAQEGMTTATDRAPSKEYDLAVKIFKTSILVFKDRDRYISGEHRFRHGYCKSNPRKMVKIWAEKEMRNLKRLTSCGVRCPVPVLIKNNVLIMRFIGKNGWGAPRLRDANLNFKRLQSCYSQCIRMMRNMYQKAGLVHGDFSEYNMLYQKG
jgi:RIO kinase 1